MSNPVVTNLNLPQMVTATADKAGFFNDVTRQLDNAMTASVDIDCSVVGSSVDPDIVTVNQVARLHALSVPSNGRGIAIPLCTRLLVLSNDANSDGNAQFTVGNTVIAVPPNNSYLVYLDGTANGALVVGAVSSGGGGGVTTLNALSDVDLTAVAPGQLIAWNGTHWVNVDPPSSGGGGGGGGTSTIVGATDYDNSVPAVAGQVIKWNGTKFAPASDNVGTGGGGGGGSGGDPGTLPAIVQTSNDTGNNTVAFPAATTPGNLLLVFGLCGANATAHPAAGWTMVANSAVGNQGGFIAAKIAASGDGVVVTPVTANPIAYQAYEISGISDDDAALAFNYAFPVVSDGAGGGGQGPGAITTTLPEVATHSLIVGAMLCDTTGALSLTGVAADGSGAAYTGGTYANYVGFHKPVVVAGDVTISGTRAAGNSDGGAHESFAIVTLAPKGATSGSGGGSGDGTLVGASDYDNTTPATNGQAILWNAAESKFKPGNVAAGGGSPGIAIQKLRLTFLPGYGYYGYCVGGIELQDANGTKVSYPAGSTYSASSVGDSSASPAANAFDGDPTTYWGSSNASNPMGTTEWIEIDMPSEVTVAAIKVYPRQPGVDVAHQFGQVGYITVVNAAGLSLDINFGKLAPIPQFGDSENRVWKLPV